jgi:hypothetical protein
MTSSRGIELSEARSASTMPLYGEILDLHAKPLSRKLAGAAAEAMKFLRNCPAMHPDLGQRY